ncbi:methylthioribose kinase-like isoform X1 [Oscarella lobularis]|uniref:methylthioribose kinase-like isoform X1 n=2 Tax=Oscarella lobularis TaxID=121494 RepID=UPI003313DD62
MSVIVKHAPTYNRCLGPSYSLTQDRLEFEYRCLERFHAIHPGSCPQPYYYDKIKSSVVIEDLKGHRIMRYDLMEGKVNLEAVRCVAKFAAHIHCATLLADLSQSDQAMLLKYFENPVIVMVQLTKD